MYRSWKGNGRRKRFISTIFFTILAVGVKTVTLQGFFSLGLLVDRRIDPGEKSFSLPHKLYLYIYVYIEREIPCISSSISDAISITVCRERPCLPTDSIHHLLTLICSFFLQVRIVRALRRPNIGKIWSANPAKLSSSGIVWNQSDLYRRIFFVLSRSVIGKEEKSLILLSFTRKKKGKKYIDPLTLDSRIFRRWRRKQLIATIHSSRRKKTKSLPITNKNIYIWFQCEVCVCVSPLYRCQFRSLIPYKNVSLVFSPSFSLFF